MNMAALTEFKQNLLLVGNCLQKEGFIVLCHGNTLWSIWMEWSRSFPNFWKPCIFLGHIQQLCIVIKGLLVTGFIGKEKPPFPKAKNGNKFSQKSSVQNKFSLLKGLAKQNKTKGRITSLARPKSTAKGLQLRFFLGPFWGWGWPCCSVHWFS